MEYDLINIEFFFTDLLGHAPKSATIKRVKIAEPDRLQTKKRDFLSKSFKRI
jgi:hypothetical protein